MKKLIISLTVCFVVFFLIADSSAITITPDKEVYLTITKNNKIQSIIQKKPEDTIQIDIISFPNNFPKKINKDEIINTLIAEKKPFYLYQDPPEIESLFPWKLAEREKILVTCQKGEIKFETQNKKPSQAQGKKNPKSTKKNFYTLYFILLLSVFLINTAMSFYAEKYYKCAAFILIIFLVEMIFYSREFILFYFFILLINFLIKTKEINLFEIVINSIMVTSIIFVILLPNEMGANIKITLFNCTVAILFIADVIISSIIQYNEKTKIRRQK